jgi:CMP-N-acetylneuraminic acid synthetase
MIVVIIPAKGGSSRLPNKNMRLIHGRPMLDYVIDYAEQCSRIDEIYVSTDSDEIAAHARSRDLPVIRRDASLGGETPLIVVYRHALQEMNNPDIDIVVGVQPDHPDRTKTLDEVLDMFLAAGSDCEVLYSTEADGTKNGAHYIMSRSFLDSGKDPATALYKKVCVIDDCTNVHYQEDLDRAAERLAANA